MNYLLDKKTVFSNSPRRRYQDNWFFLVVVILVLLIGGPILYKIFSAPATQLVGHGRNQTAGFVSALAHDFKFFSSKESLVAENYKLKEELKKASALGLSLRAELEEYRALDSAIGHSLAASSSTLVGKVLAPIGLFNYDSLLIDLGRKNSPTLGAGDLVVATNNIILGEVVEVGALTTKVKLYSTAGRKTSVLIGEENIVGLATGQGGGNYLVTLPAGSMVVHNDIVRASRNGREYILGLVGAVDKNDETPFQKVFIKIPLNIYELRFVQIHDR